jgi:hypothetical protein
MGQNLWHRQWSIIVFIHRAICLTIQTGIGLQHKCRKHAHLPKTNCERDTVIFSKNLKFNIEY